MHSDLAVTPQENSRLPDDFPRVASDHRAVRLKVALSSVKFKARAMSRGTINWPKILTKHTQMVYNEHLLSLTTTGIEYDDYQEIILKAGMLTATHHK
jgi:hypothetical protein